MGGDNGGKREKGFQEQLQGTHGQNQGGVESGEEGGEGWGGGEVGGKGRKLYLNNNKIKKKEAKVSNCHIEYKHNCV